MRRLLHSVVAFLAITSMVAADPLAPQKELPGVSVQLVFSVKEFDPAEPAKATMKCVVRNKTKAAVEAPGEFHQKVTKIQASGLDLINWDVEKRKVKPTTMRVGPDEEKVIFELPLDEILLREGKTNPWYWSWLRRPPPPHSPIHQPREKNKFVDSATFTVTVVINGQEVKSNEAELRVKVK